MIRWLFALLLALSAVALAGRARAEPIRVLVAAAHRDGIEGERPLHHARDDVQRVRELFTTLGGVRPENALVLDEPTPEELFTALDRARVIAASHRQDEVTLVVYFSGHGDHQAIHLGRQVVPLVDIATRIGAVPAALKIVVVDACRTMQLRPKGISTEPAFSISLTPPAATGAVWLHASADGEVAQESDELGGAIFTHYWIDGLRGAADADGDHRVTLSESYDFAYHQTLYRSARGSGVLQRPAVSFTLKESNPIVLTEPARERSVILFPQSADTHYVVYSLGSHTVTDEVWGRPDRPVLLALPAGRYMIQRRAEGSDGAVEIALGREERRALAGSDFRPFAPETLAQKGGELDVWPHEIELAYGARTAPGDARLFDVAEVVRARYAHRVSGVFSLSFGADAGLGARSTAALDARVVWGGASARAELRPSLGSIDVRLGLGPAASFVAQRLRRQDAARVALAGYPTEQHFHALLAGAESIVGARYHLAPRVALGIDLDGALLFGDGAGSPAIYPSGGASAAVDVRF